MNNKNTTETDAAASKKRKAKMKKLRCRNGITVRADIGFALDREPSKLYPIVQYLLTVMASISVLNMFRSYLDADYMYIIGDPNMMYYTILLTAGACLIVHRGKTFFKAAGVVYMLLNTVYVLYNVLKQDSAITEAIDYTSRLYLSKIPLPQYENMIVGRPPYMQEKLTVLFIAAAFMVTMLVAISSIYYTNFPILFLCTFPSFLIGVYWEWKPSNSSVVIMIACWITSLSLSLINHTATKKTSGNNFAVSVRRKTFYLTSYDIKQRFFFTHSAAAFITALLVFTTVFGAVSFKAEKIEKERPQKITQLRKEITQRFNKLANDVQEGRLPTFRSIPGRGRQTGGTNGGQLGIYDNIQFKGSEMMILKTEPFSRPIYLRGYAAEEYINNRWDPVEPDSAVTEYFDSKDRMILDYTMIRNYQFDKNKYSDLLELTNLHAAEDLIYAPYGTNYTNCNNVEHQVYDGIASPVNQKIKYYKLRSVLPEGMLWDDMLDYAQQKSAAGLPDDYSIYSKSICRNNTYRELSEEQSRLLQKIIRESGIDTNSYEPLSQSVKKLRGWFRDNGFTYARDPGITPDGEDFIVYFLTEQKKGYCTYYASTAVMLMRMLGYPARYVEGYIVEPSQTDDSKPYISIPDNSAHAWCEIFIEGSGWYPVELTPGYETNENPNLTDAQKGNSDSESNADSSAADSSVNDDSGSKADNQSSAADSGNSSANTSADTSETISGGEGSAADGGDTSDDSSREALFYPAGTDSGDGDGSNTPLISKEQALYLLMISLFVIGFAAAVVIRRKRVLEKIEEGVNSASGSRSVICCYTSLLRYVSLLGIESDKNMTDVQLSSKIRMELTYMPELKDAFRHISETAITTYMSGRETDPEAAERSRTLFMKAREMIYDKLNAVQRFSAKWISGLY